MTEVVGIPVEERRVKSADGTEIAYYVGGRGRHDLVLAPGLGTHLYCWKYVLEGFQGVYRMITWDPRGTYKSGRPATHEAVRVEDHVRDFAAIRRAERLDTFALAGWSMGVQIALEHIHQFPRTVRALVLINGAYKHLLRTAMNVPFAGHVFPPIVRALKHLDPALRPIAEVVFAAEWAPRLLIATGLLASNGAFFGNVLREFSRMDWRTYFSLMLALNEHSAEPYLADVKVPTLITAGTKDYMTPVATARALQRGIPGSELALFPGGTHYTQMEFHAEMHRTLEDFLKRADPAAFG